MDSKEIQDRDQLYREMDSHIVTSRKKDSTLFTEGKPKLSAEKPYGHRGGSFFSHLLDRLSLRRSGSMSSDEEDEDTGITEREELEKRADEDEGRPGGPDKAEERPAQKPAEHRGFAGWLRTIFGAGEEEREEQLRKRAREEGQPRPGEEADYEGHAEDERQDERERDREKQGLIATLFGKLFLKEDEEPEEAWKSGDARGEELPEPSEIRQDMKSVAAYSLELIKKMPKSEVLKLKDDEDFKEYKNILRKHHIIR